MNQNNPETRKRGTSLEHQIDSELVLGKEQSSYPEIPEVSREAVSETVRSSDMDAATAIFDLGEAHLADAHGWEASTKAQSERTTESPRAVDTAAGAPPAMFEDGNFGNALVRAINADRGF